MEKGLLLKAYKILLPSHSIINENKTHVDIHKLIDLISNMSADDINLPELWYSPLLIGLKEGSPYQISLILDSLTNLYSAYLLNFSLVNGNHILTEIAEIINNYSKAVYSTASINLTRFCLGVIIGEKSIDSPVHGQIILKFIQAMFNSALYGYTKESCTIARSALTQAVQTIAQRFEDPPIYTTQAQKIAFQAAHSAVYSILSPYLFDILDNSSSIPQPSNVYESDALIVLKVLCSSVEENDVNSTVVSIDLVKSFISIDKNHIYTSMSYLQLIKNLVCSLILQYCQSSSFPVFRSTIALCTLVMTRYIDILKAESSVFFSTLFFRILDNTTQNLNPKSNVKNITQNFHNPIIPFKKFVIKCLNLLPASFLAEVFLNFDMDLDLRKANILEHIFNSLTKTDVNEVPEALHCIANLLHSLDDWSSKLILDQRAINSQANHTESNAIKKKRYSHAIDAFNADPEHNLKELISSGLVPQDAHEIALFLHSHSQFLSPISVGNLLGSHDSFHLQIMHEYIDMIDFSGMPICEGLFHFLSFFTLPKESQQIDRLLEKFADTYYKCNQSSGFRNASVVYDASFAALLVYTDSHNPEVKNRMSKSEFVELYQQMEEGDALSIEEIEGIFNYVTTHTVESISNRNLYSSDFRSPSRMGNDYYKESIEHIREAQHRMKSGGDSAIKWIRPAAPDTVRSIFEIIWSPITAMAAKVLSDQTMPDKCISSALTIFTSSIGISSRFYMETESLCCMSSLFNFTRLQPWASIHPQNVIAIKRLLQMAKSFSNYFEPVWEKLLSLIANLQHYLSSSSNRFDNIISDSISVQDLDALFESSITFPTAAIVPFVSALCKVSNNEFSQRPPKMFCLQKIVEVTAFNMGRARFVWQMIWKPVSQHMIEAGCFPQESVARMALDSLRQLAGKFLQREEFAAFHYQKDFLRPFHAILRKSKLKVIRLHTLRCLNYTVNRFHSNLKSGWDAALSMLESAAGIAEVNRLALTVLIDIVEKHMSEIVEQGFLGNAIRAASTFIKVRGSIGLSAVYVIVGALQCIFNMNLQNTKNGIDATKKILVAIREFLPKQKYATHVLSIVKTMDKLTQPALLDMFIEEVLIGANFVKEEKELIQFLLLIKAGEKTQGQLKLKDECIRSSIPEISSIE